ncbi:MAG: hypothetical protein H6573_09415 [Lewinellaceae bacterium]|nr:hypothetical protein [Phaeodactylibacter sp.]MCB9347713.1 hypothetical protein [Lewinellaceae bacterium]
MKKETIEELLLRSFEQQLSAEERGRLDAALAGSEELRREQQQLEKVRHWLGSLQATPKNGFVDGVMKELNTSPVEATLLSILPRAAAACLIVLLLTLIGIYMAEGSLSTDAIIGVNNLAPEDAYSYLEY